jgi:transcriptional regulator with XRE-family HTH domain
MNKIKVEREKQGMSRAELSRLSGVPSRTIDDWENERRIPRDVYQIKKVADALRATIEDIIDFN